MTASFLGLRVVPVALEQRATLEPFLRDHPHRLSGYTFASLVAWTSIFDYRFSLATPELLFISYVLEPDPHRHLLQPLGRLSEADGRALLQAARALPYPLKVGGVEERFLAENPAFAQRFGVSEDRDAANYLYRAEDLARLAGKRYAAKRNHIAQAERENPWTAEALRAEACGDCHALMAELDLEEPVPQDRNRRWERVALNYAIDHFAELGLQGVLLRVGGTPAAFSLFEKLDADTAVIHFERALRRYKGLYQVVNREAARTLLEQGHRFINREEDVGDPGLRKAKLSYHPSELVRAFMLTLRR